MFKSLSSESPRHHCSLVWPVFLIRYLIWCCLLLLMFQKWLFVSSYLYRMRQLRLALKDLWCGGRWFSLMKQRDCPVCFVRRWESVASLIAWSSAVQLSFFGRPLRHTGTSPRCSPLQYTAGNPLAFTRVAWLGSILASAMAKRSCSLLLHFAQRNLILAFSWSANSVEGGWNRTRWSISVIFLVLRSEGVCCYGKLL